VHAQRGITARLQSVYLLSAAKQSPDPASYPGAEGAQQAPKNPKALTIPD
jgi:hypothetical protein